MITSDYTQKVYNFHKQNYPLIIGHSGTGDSINLENMCYAELDAFRKEGFGNGKSMLAPFGVHLVQKPAMKKMQ